MTSDQVKNIEQKVAFGLGTAIVTYCQSPTAATIPPQIATFGTYVGGLLVAWGAVKSHQLNAAPPSVTASTTATVTTTAPKPGTIGQ
jgi:hypothetical protein